MMTLFDIIMKNKIKSLSIVGMAKNVGKTVTLNYLIEEAAGRGMVLGLTSAGRDGERKDVVYGTRKPGIWVHEGSLIATARKYIVKSQAGIEVIYNTEINTPMGEVIIGRVRESGEIELAGPGPSSGIKQVIDLMEEFGGQLVLVDGALDRASSAAPTVTEGTILATGAVLGHSIETIIEKTRLRVELFRLKTVDDEKVKQMAFKVIEEGKTGIITDTGLKTLNQGSVLLSGKEISSLIDESTRAVVISGAVTDRFMKDLINVPHLKDAYIIVKDGIKIFPDVMTYKQLKRKGVEFRVLDPINLLALTVNPCSPYGYNFDPDEFLERIGSAIGSIPVYDVVLGKGANVLEAGSWKLEVGN